MYINEEILAKYQTLENQYQFIPCESIFDASKVPFLFQKRLYSKTRRKSIEIEQLLAQSKHNYEAVLFQN